MTFLSPKLGVFNKWILQAFFSITDDKSKGYCETYLGSE